MSDEPVGNRHLKKLTKLKSHSDNQQVQDSLDTLCRATEGSENTKPFILDAVSA